MPGRLEFQSLPAVVTTILIKHVVLLLALPTIPVRKQFAKRMDPALMSTSLVLAMMQTNAQQMTNATMGIALVLQEFATITTPVQMTLVIVIRDVFTPTTPMNAMIEMNAQ